MPTSARLAGIAAVAAGMLVIGSPAFASAGGPPQLDLEDVQAQVSHNEGGGSGNGGAGGTGVNACGVLPVVNNSVQCTSGNGNDGGAGGSAGSTQRN